jgi:hypothetical protein
MVMSRLGLLLFVLLTAGILAACEGDSASPVAADAAIESTGSLTLSSANGRPTTGGGVGTMAYCDGSDCDGGGGPAGTPPGAGISIPDLTMNACRNRTVSGVDRDNDYLDDECEWKIAYNFAPALRFTYGDTTTSRETYWAAHAKEACVTAETNDTINFYCLEWLPVIRVFYALGYHKDGGWSFAFPAHNGDSEFLIVEVAYDHQEETWKHTRTFMSSHQGSPSGESGWWYHNWRDRGYIEYPYTVNGYHRVWVEKNKHANYGTEATCDDGPAGGCGSGWQERVDVRIEDNIGEYSHNLLTFVSSRQGYPGTECFWCIGSFRGWHSSGQTTGYRDYLEAAMSRPNMKDWCLNTCVS